MNLRESRARLTAAEEAYKTAQPGRDLTAARQELTEARVDYYAACADVVERLDYLLGPFALEAELYRDNIKDSVVPTLDDGDGTNYTVGDLRALAKLWEEVR